MAPLSIQSLLGGAYRLVPRGDHIIWCNFDNSAHMTLYTCSIIVSLNEQQQRLLCFIQ